ncbi:hypothetical protein [Sphingomonas oligophenolica]|uniref:Uncharacterized protein n=1 Tax=Sphingomonas oligophenolica TaxID=301154 RepID=A0A502CNF4_9SPHN|nr:hypothetical protein [Sphingomonas oligophenolica]TPG14388.1 hypothetical protein EAH84_03510 [Sphingomonas oligophenolica]
MKPHDLTGTRRPMVATIHDRRCDCPRCAPPGPSVPDRLTANDIGKLMIAGVLAGNAIAFAIDPHGSAQALLAVVQSFAS